MKFGIENQSCSLLVRIEDENRFCIDSQGFFIKIIGFLKKVYEILSSDLPWMAMKVQMS